MNNFTYERLHNNLHYLKLDTIEAILDNYLELAAKDSMTTMEVLDYLLEQERKNRDAAATTVLHQLDQKIIHLHYDFKHLTEKYFEIGMKLNDFSIQLVKY